MIDKIKNYLFNIYIMYYKMKHGDIVRKKCAGCGKSSYYDIASLNINKETRFLCKGCFDKELLNGETATK